MSYRTVDPERLAETILRLKQRIEERFPGAGLARVAAELGELARTTTDRVAAIARPNIGLRIGIVLVALAGLAAFVRLATLIEVRLQSESAISVLQGAEAGFNLVLLIGAALIFLVSAERRLKRRRALAGLHEFRSIVHVIDMHQLTKDPAAVLGQGPATASSPQRTFTPFELSRYLDYCSEMLSLTAKVAALYAQALPDSEIVSTVADIEQLTANLSQKIWQKIAILESAVSAELGQEGRPAAAELPNGRRPAAIAPL